MSTRAKGDVLGIIEQNDDLFEELETDCSVDELELRESETGFAFAIAPNGNAVEIVWEGEVTFREALEEDYEDSESIRNRPLTWAE